MGRKFFLPEEVISMCTEVEVLKGTTPEMPQWTLRTYKTLQF